MKITCEDVVRALKQLGRTVTAKQIAGRFGVESRAVATAARRAIEDGRIYAYYKGSVAHYRFVRIKAKVAP